MDIKYMGMMDQQPKDLREEWQREQNLMDMQQPTGPDEDPNDPLGLRSEYLKDTNQGSSTFDVAKEKIDIEALAAKEMHEENSIEKGMN
jgi:hypothetical protein